MIDLAIVGETKDLSRDGSDAALRSTVATALTVAKFFKNLGMAPCPIQITITVNGKKYTVDALAQGEQPW